MSQRELRFKYTLPLYYQKYFKLMQHGPCCSFWGPMRNVFWADNEMYKLREIRFLLKRDVSECIWRKSGRWTEMAFDSIAIKAHF